MSLPNLIQIVYAAYLSIVRYVAAIRLYVITLLTDPLNSMTFQDAFDKVKKDRNE